MNIDEINRLELGSFEEPRTTRRGMPLDYRDPQSIGLIAARINALTTAASCIATGSAPADHLERASVSEYLIEMAGNLARSIADAADAYELSQSTANRAE